MLALVGVVERTGSHKRPIGHFAPYNLVSLPKRHPLQYQFIDPLHAEKHVVFGIGQPDQASPAGF